MKFACWDSLEPISYGMCDVYMGCGVWFVVGDSFMC